MCFLSCLYRSPSQAQHKFENFCTKLITLMDHINNELPICSVITGDLNARCSKWCNIDINNSFGHEVDTLMSSAGYKQIINKPTRIVNNSSSCIDFLFCNNLNLIANYGVNLSLFENCHHNIIFGKFPFPRAMFVKCGIIVALILKICKKLFGILIGKRYLEIFLLTEKSIF